MRCGFTRNDMPGFRPELNLRAQNKRALRTLKNSSKGCPSGLSYQPDHSWSGGRPMLLHKVSEGPQSPLLNQGMQSWGLRRSGADACAR